MLRKATGWGKRYKRKWDGIAVLAAVFITGVFLGAELIVPLPAEYSDDTEVKNFIVGTQRDRVKMTVPAVDEDGSGLYTYLYVETRSGDGQVLINIDKLSFWLDTQESFQTAKSVASEHTGIPGDSFDVIYSVAADEATVVGGPSAGAALAIATIFSLQGEIPREDVVITGTVESGGRVGKVGGILEKARAAKDSGASLFLVPVGEGAERTTKPVKKCEHAGGFEFCRVIYKTEVVSIGESIGIEVVEVSDVGEAVKYFSR